MRTPEVECTRKGKFRHRCQFGVKVGFAVTARRGRIVGSRIFPRNRYQGNTLAERLEHAETLSGEKSQAAIVYLGYGWQKPQECGDPAMR